MDSFVRRALSEDKGVHSFKTLITIRNIIENDIARRPLRGRLTTSRQGAIRFRTRSRPWPSSRGGGRGRFSPKPPRAGTKKAAQVAAPLAPALARASACDPFSLAERVDASLDLRFLELDVFADTRVIFPHRHFFGHRAGIFSSQRKSPYSASAHQLDLDGRRLGHGPVPRNIDASATGATHAAGPGP